jgi:hypothetical protein
VVVCNDPGFCQIFGGNFLPFALLEMIGISQGFKTFLVYLKALLENHFKPSIIFLKISLQACLQKKSLTK